MRRKEHGGGRDSYGQHQNSKHSKVVIQDQGKTVFEGTLEQYAEWRKPIVAEVKARKLRELKAIEPSKSQGANI